MSEQETEVTAVVVETVKVELEVGKETKDIADCVHDLIQDVRAGKDVTSISLENLPNLVKAIDGFDKLDDEAKHSSRNATYGYCAYKLADSLLPVKDA